MTEKKTASRAPAVWRPFGETESWPGLLEGFGTRLPRLWEEMFRDWPGGPGRGQGFVPAIDVHDDDHHYTVTVELPGAKKDDIHIEVEQGMLTLRGEKKSEREERKEKRRWVERSYGSFSRSFTLPRDADAERLEASFKDGVLTLTIPKSEAAKPRTIAIK